MSNKTIYYFNPTCEMAVANGSPYYQAPAILRDFEHCLSPTLLWFAKENDILITENHIEIEQIEIFNTLGINNIQILPRKEALNILLKKNERIKLSPWGWSPAMKYIFNDILNITENLPMSGTDFFRKRYERKNAVELLKNISREFNSSFLLDAEYLPKIIHSEEEAEGLLSKWGKIVLKAPLSSSGRGLQIVRSMPLNKSKREWIRTILKQQSYLTCEPLLEKKADFSFQFYVRENKEVDYLGISAFETNNNGQYKGHFINIEPKILQEFRKLLPVGFMNELIEFIRLSLQCSDYKKMEGYIGIDALVYKENEELKLYPCVEINPRMNMGALSLKIQLRTHQNSNGFFGIYNGNNFADFKRKEVQKNPPTVVDGKLYQGFYSLSEVKPNQRFGSYINLSAD